MSPENNVKIANQILRENDLKGTYQHTKKGTFIYKFPTPRERAYIEQQIAVKIGVPVENYHQDEYLTVRMCVYLDNILVETPSWWTSAEDCYDEELIYQIFKHYHESQEAFRGRLRQGKFKGSS